ncbi:MAG: peptide chain release factor N(5)-glutamine methyltransferase [Kiritimatiellales bacterium]|nr:peptide chain release factor N(5)-glutamine methyltransferase [Kiritimatiellales bacterium]
MDMKHFQTLEQRLASAGSGNPKRSVEELAAHVLGCKPLEIYFRELTVEQESQLETLIARAELGEPIQYIIGHVDFRGLEIACDPRALIPRPETELLVDVVLENVDATPSSRHIRKERDEGVASTLKIADVCTGTGCIGLALAHELPSAQVTAIDISPEALSLARENAEQLGLSEKFQCLENNLLEGIDENSFDIVVSNPPYIFSKVWKNLEPCVRDHEPQLALDGGEQGMDLIIPLVEQAARVLKPGGELFLEIGYDQGQETSCTLRKAGLENVRIIKDYAGLDRIVAGSKAKS